MLRKYMIIALGALVVGHQADGMVSLYRRVSPVVGVLASASLRLKAAPVLRAGLAKFSTQSSDWVILELEKSYQPILPTEFSYLCSDPRVPASVIETTLSRQPELVMVKEQQYKEQSLYGDTGVYCDSFNYSDFDNALTKAAILHEYGAPVLPTDVLATEHAAVLAADEQNTLGCKFCQKMSNIFRAILKKSKQ